MFAVLFEDDTNLAAEVRRQHMAAHLAFLVRNAESIRAAGPLATVDGEPAGGLWIVDTSDADVVDRLVREDPFWATGLRHSVRILAWRQVFAEGKPRITP